MITEQPELPCEERLLFCFIDPNRLLEGFIQAAHITFHQSRQGRQLSVPAIPVKNQGRQWSRLQHRGHIFFKTGGGVIGHERSGAVIFLVETNIFDLQRLADIRRNNVIEPVVVVTAQVATQIHNHILDAQFFRRNEKFPERTFVIVAVIKKRMDRHIGPVFLGFAHKAQVIGNLHRGRLAFILTSFFFQLVKLKHRRILKETAHHLLPGITLLLFFHIAVSLVVRIEQIVAEADDGKVTDHSFGSLQPLNLFSIKIY